MSFNSFSLYPSPSLSLSFLFRLPCKALVEVYNPCTNSWSTVTPMPEPRGHISNSVFSIPGRGIFVVGGATNGRYEAHTHTHTHTMVLLGYASSPEFPPSFVRDHCSATQRICNLFTTVSCSSRCMCHFHSSISRSLVLIIFSRTIHF